MLQVIVISNFASPFQRRELVGKCLSVRITAVIVFIVLELHKQDVQFVKNMARKPVLPAERITS